MEIQNRERGRQKRVRERDRERDQERMLEREAVSLSRVTSSSDCDAIYMMDD